MCKLQLVLGTLLSLGACATQPRQAPKGTAPAAEPATAAPAVQPTWWCNCDGNRENCHCEGSAESCEGMRDAMLAQHPEVVLPPCAKAATAACFHYATPDVIDPGRTCFPTLTVCDAARDFMRIHAPELQVLDDCAVYAWDWFARLECPRRPQEFPRGRRAATAGPPPRIWRAGTGEVRLARLSTAPAMSHLAALTPRRSHSIARGFE